MKQFYFIVAGILFSLITSAAPVNTVLSNGKWSQVATWSEGRLPQDADTVVVPAGTTLLIDNNVSLSTAAIYLKVYGTIEMKVGRLDLGVNSFIILFDGGSIQNTNGNNSEKITIGGVSKYLGNEGMITGLAAASQYTGTSPYGFSPAMTSALPVKFASFTVARRNQDVLVQWSTSQEVNARAFEVERSLDGNTWVKASEIAAAGNSITMKYYSYTDKNITAAVVYYRIRQVDIDGRSTYTSIQSLKSHAAQDVKVFATTNTIILQFTTEVKGKVQVQVMSLNGQVLNRQVLNNPAGQVTIPVALQGSYVVSVNDSRGMASAQKVIL
ncbi:MAG TPA: T9SS type A sorting domain-containing protein [Flavisolibacter sp.]